jgi:hypothetical protein
VNRAIFSALVLAVTIGSGRATVAASESAAKSAAHPQPIVAEVTLQRDANELLAPFTVAITVNNTTSGVVRLNFPTADLFRIDVIKDDSPIWSSLQGHKPIPVNRVIDVPPGRLKLASMTVDGTTVDRRAYAPGRYIVRVAMLGTTFGMIVDKQLDFVAPTPIADVANLKPGTVVTIAGTQTVLGGVAQLNDASGSIRLSRSLGIRPSGVYVVRGFLDAVRDDRIFDVGRFAPAYDNAPSPAPD